MTYERTREKAWALAGIKHNGRSLDFGTWKALVVLQREKCGLCGCLALWQPLFADHDHRTGELRGALCYRCNRLRVGCIERGGHFRGSREHWQPREDAVRYYLDHPPAWELHASPAAD